MSASVERAGHPAARPRSSAVQRVVAGLVGRPAFWVGTMALLFGVPLTAAMLRPVPVPLTVLGQLPDFRLLDAAGQPLDRASLPGRVWLLGFADTTCQPCVERLADALDRLRHRSRNVGPAVGLISVALGPALGPVDPVREAARAHPGVRPWHVTAGADAEALLGAMSALVPERGPALRAGRAIALVDGLGRVRAVEATDRSLDPLVRAITLLLNQPAE